MVILSKGCKPYNFESQNSLKLSAANIQGLRSNFIDCKSFLESYSPEIPPLFGTNLSDWNDSGNFSVRGCLPLIWKDSATHMDGLTVYVKEGLPFARDLSLENSGNSYLCFWLAIFTYCLTSFSSIDHLLRLYAIRARKIWCTVVSCIIRAPYIFSRSTKYRAPRLNILESKSFWI